MASLSKRMKSDVDAFSLRKMEPSMSGGEFGGRFLTAAAISAQEGGPGGASPPLAMARAEEVEVGNRRKERRNTGMRRREQISRHLSLFIFYPLVLYELLALK